jgi:ABC-type sugar transport system substrate-binding protein
MRLTSSSTTWRKAASLIAAGCLLVAACGGDDDTADDATEGDTGAIESDNTANSNDTADSDDTGETGDTADTVVATQSEGLDSGLGGRGENRRVVFIADNPPSDSFWGKIQRGAQDAATLFNLELDFQFTDGADIAAYNDLIGTAIATEPAGIAVVIRDPDALTDNICAAHDAGIQVVSYNITQGGDVAECFDGFIGQDFPTAGKLAAEQMVALAGIGSGDKVLLPVEQPEASYAVDRASGVTPVLDAIGAEWEIVEAGATGDAQALENITQYLVGNPDTKAIIPMGGTPHRNAVQAIADAGLSTDDVKVGGFDIDAIVAQNIEDGDSLVAVTQEPYIQGFQAIAELALFIDFGITPFSINTGAGVVTVDNIADFKDVAETIR